MGWNEGGGLGANLTGTTSHVKVNKRGSNAGVGLKESHDDDWIAHQDDFNNLLSALNGKPAGGNDAATSVENKMKASKHRYTKFVKSKDLSNASSDDLACIFGQRGKSTATSTNEVKHSEEDGSSGESSSDENVVGDIKTIESTLSMNEYFAKKMAAIKQKQSVSLSTNGFFVEKQTEKCSEEESPHGSPSHNHREEVKADTTVCKVKKKKKKHRNEASTEDETKIAVVVAAKDNDEILIVKKKKKKKSKENAEDVESMEAVSEPTTEDSKQHLPSQPLCTDETDSITVVKKKKKKKQAIVVEETEDESPAAVVCSKSADIVLENGLVKKKKKKKRKHEESTQPLQDNSNTQTDVEVVKKKKKKKLSAEIV